MSLVGHIPVRTCLGCARRDPQSGLLRIAAKPDGLLAVDSTRRLGGRGGYLHRQESCWQQFASRKGHVRSLGRAIDKTARLAVTATLRRGSDA